MPDRALRREFAIFARYLGASDDVSEIASSYVAMHGSAASIGSTRWDDALVRFARAGVIATAVADAYARLTTPRGLLRRKLVLALALLESAAMSHAQFDSARPASRFATLMALSSMMAMWALRALCAVVLLAPAHALTRLLTARNPRG